MRPSSEDASSGSTSKCPHRLVSPSIQLWICRFGVIPVVESVCIVSDINPATGLIRRFDANRDQRCRSPQPRLRDVYLEFERSFGTSAIVPLPPLKVNPPP